MFTDQEYELLLKAVDSLEKVECMGNAMSGMMLSLLCRDEEQLKKAQIEAERQESLAETKRRVLAERCILLKAKIVQMRQGMAADKLFDASGRNEVVSR